jgi:hypothetical protein
MVLGIVMSKYKIMAAALTMMAIGLSAELQAQSGGIRDRLKPDKCFAKNGDEIKCEEVAAQTVPAKYPNATRVEPSFPKTKLKKEWNDMVNAANAEKKDASAILVAAQVILDHPDASINEKSEAANLMTQAYLTLDKNSFAKPIEFARKAIDLNGLGNNNHFQLMFVLSQMHLAEKQYAEALATIDRFSKETASEDVPSLRVRGNALYRLGRYADAAVTLRKAYNQDKGADANLATMLMDSYSRTGQKAEADKIADEIAKATPAGDPNDKSAQVKQLLVLANAKQYEKAAKVFDELYAKGQITQLNEYEAGYISYSYLEGKEAKAIAIIKDGMGKGIISPDATVYNVLGQSYYYTNEPKAAAEAWGKAAALSPKGEYDLLLARVLAEESEYAKAKSAANAALSKGIASRGEAYLIIAEAESEFGLDNKTAMQAALREAMKDPETQDRASKMMKNAGLK